MSPKVLSSMELEADFEGEDVSSNDGLQELWPLGEIDPKRARFPCCIVWTPLPVVSWLVDCKESRHFFVFSHLICMHDMQTINIFQYDSYF